jgi:hypothetical protein
MLLSWIWGWMDTAVSNNKSVDLFSDLLVSDISLVLLRKVLEFWVQSSIDGMLFSWIWSWVHAVVSVDKSMDFLSDLFVSNICLLGKGFKMLEIWVA